MILEMIKRQNLFILYIYLYVFLMPWNLFNGQMGVLTVILLIWWLTVGKEHGYFKNLNNILKFVPLVLIIGYFLYCYLSLLWTENYFSAFNDSLKFYKYYWVMIPVLFSSLNKDEALNCIYFLVTSLGSYAVFSLSLYLDIFYLPESFLNSGGPRGILSYALVSLYMAIGFFFSVLLMLFTEDKKLKNLFFVIAIFCFIGLVINNGRGAQVAFLITLIIFLFFKRKYFFNLKIIISTIIISILSVSIFVNTNSYDRYASGVHDLMNSEKNGYSGSWGQRAYMWVAASNIVEQNPILGVGAGDNIDAFLEFSQGETNNAIWLRSFHNQHLDILTRYGILGYLLLLSSVILLLYFSAKVGKLYFYLSVSFFSLTFFASLADILLLMKPFNNIFMLLFILMSVIIFNTNKEKNIL